MWHRLPSDLAYFWSKLWPPLLAASLTATFVYLLRRREERRELRKKLSGEIYIPARRQLAEASQAIEKYQRAFQVDSELWKRARNTGLANKIKPTLKLRLETLYESTLPRHDGAWQGLNVEIERMGGEWDKRYADILSQTALSRALTFVPINWWTFLAADGPVTPVDGLRDNNVLRIWNGFMTPARFKLLGRSVEQFLTDLWHEAARNEAVRYYKEIRKRALADIPEAIAALDRESLY